MGLLKKVFDWLTGGFLSRVFDFIDKRLDNDVKREEMRLKAVEAHIAQQSSVIKTGMANRVFWWAWGIFTLPLGLWFAAVVIDTIFRFGWGIPTLPIAIQPWADQIVGNIFLPGAGLIGVNMAASAWMRRK